MTRLAETLALRAPNGTTVPLIERGETLPATKETLLSTSRDDQDAIRCTLVAIGAHVRTLGELWVGVEPAPRGVASARLVVRIDAHGDSHVTIVSREANAEATFGLAVAS